MLKRNGAAEIRDGRFFLTERGFEVHSYIVEELVSEWESADAGHERCRKKG